MFFEGALHFEKPYLLIFKDVIFDSKVDSMQPPVLQPLLSVGLPAPRHSRAAGQSSSNDLFLWG